MDRFDADILHELERDGRISWVRLAERVNLSPSACQRRVESLRSNGVIERFTVRLD
ncbi:MAG: AsnC family transcriptional regulator [Gammaproteobacteria bacterium]|nr:AsnC family transcriptional regulator [Gammaproteobacteria bacterium]